MSDFKNWCRFFVIVVIVGGLLQNILPANKLNSAYKTFFSVLMISILLIPLSKNGINWYNDLTGEQNYITESELTVYRDELISEVARETVKNGIDEYLYNLNTSAFVNNIEITFQENKIEDIFIEINGIFNYEERERINEYIYEILGGDVRIEYK